MSELKPCPFCGGKALYEVYHNVDGFDMPFMFCNWCKAMFTVEGSEDWVHGNRDGMGELRAAWNRREHTAKVVEDEFGYLLCSECGAIQPEDYETYYCWNCGARQVGGWS